MSSPSTAAAGMRTAIESPTLESPTLRLACDNIRNVIFPPSGYANCNANDIAEFLSIVTLNRKGSLSAGAPLLTPNTMLQALDYLIIQAPFYTKNRNRETFKNGNRETFALRSYLLLVSEMLRSFAQDVQKLRHKIRERWYDGISALSKYAEEVTVDCGKRYQIDAWDATFLLKHTQYLLTQIEDSYSLTDNLVERATLMAMAAALTYNQSWKAIGAYKGLVMI
jgi:hypothetical protein